LTTVLPSLQLLHEDGCYLADRMVDLWTRAEVRLRQAGEHGDRVPLAARELDDADLVAYNTQQTSALRGHLSVWEPRSHAAGRRVRCAWWVSVEPRERAVPVTPLSLTRSRRMSVAALSLTAIMDVARSRRETTASSAKVDSPVGPAVLSAALVRTISEGSIFPALTCRQNSSATSSLKTEAATTGSSSETPASS